MMHRPLFCFLFLLSIFPLIYAHSTAPRASLNNCQNLERLNRTVHRVSPILERLFHLNANNGKALAPALNGSVGATQKRDFGNTIQKIQSVQVLLGQSKNKISDKMMTCQEPNLGTNGVLGGNKRDEDDKCTLDEVLEELLDELTDSLECLLSVTFSLLGGVLELVFNMLSGIVHLTGELVDLD